MAGKAWWEAKEIEDTALALGLFGAERPEVTKKAMAEALSNAASAIAGYRLRGATPHTPMAFESKLTDLLSAASTMGGVKIDMQMQTLRPATQPRKIKYTIEVTVDEIET